MNKKLSIIIISILLLVIIGLSIFIVYNYNNDKELNNNVDKNHNTNNTTNEPTDINKLKELVTGDSVKIEYNSKMAEYKKNIRLQRILDSKTSTKNGEVIFNNGKFNDTEKYVLCSLKIDLESVGEKIKDKPAYLVSESTIQTACKELFNEEVNLSKVENIEKQSNKYVIGTSTGAGLEIYKVKSLVYNEDTKEYTLIFDHLKYNEKYIDANVLDYTNTDVENTYKLVYKMDGDNFILLTVNLVK